MRILKAIAVAFSIYSKIPMPHFEWKKEDLKYNIVFLPWIGAVIGIISYAMGLLLMKSSIERAAQACILTIIPMLITGGFHVDGFLDVSDALKSYKSKEEKLEIMKDPHIGAFAIINFALYGILWMAALITICNKMNLELLKIFCIIFFVCRAVDAILAVCLGKAKKEGMLNDEVEGVNKVAIVGVAIQLILGVGMMVYINYFYALICIVVLSYFSYTYKRMCYKQFGGVTGDTAGYFLIMSELLCLIGISVGAYIGL